MKKLTLMIHVDALRRDYVTESDMPFLFNLAKTGIGANIIPPFGFEPDGAYLTGTYPEIYEGGVHFVFNENKHRIPFINLFPDYLDKLNIYAQYPFRRILRYLIKKKGETARITKQPFIYQIPFKFLKYFYFNDVLFPYEEGFAKEALTIYDYIRGKNKTFYYASYPKLSSEASKIKKHIFEHFKGNVDFLFLMISDLDLTGHDFGPNSIVRKKCAKFVDEILKDIYEYVFSFYDEIDFIGFGDHGMVEVEENIDFEVMLKDLPIKAGEDYFYFLDSTFARFWFLNDGAKNYISDFLANLDFGTIVSQKDIKEYKINYKNRKFGDLIFWLNGGKVIYPSFWQGRNEKKGMHGYRKEIKDNHAAFVFNSSKKRKYRKVDTIEMYDVFQTAYFSLFNKANDSVSVNGRPIQEW